MAKILHLKDYEDYSEFIAKVQELNSHQSRFDLYWNRDLGWLWTTADVRLFWNIMEFFANKGWGVIDTDPPEPADQPEPPRIITLTQ